MINRPTRVCEKSATLIDNILTNKKGPGDILSGILYTDITDHYPVFCVDRSNTVETKDEYVSKRMYGHRNIEKFKENLRKVEWNEVLQTKDPQVAYTAFYNKLSSIYNTCFPIRRFKKTYRTKKPWITENLSKSINTKNKLMAKSKKQPYNMKLQSKYMDFKRTLQKTIRFAEKKYYDDLFAQHRCNLVQSWKIIKDVINRRKCNKIPKYFIVDDVKTDDRKQISEGFNRFYVNLGPSLAKKIPNNKIDPMTFLKPPIQEELMLSMVTENDIKD